ncbi:uncharacterized protein SPPG_08194 [Spizellomyces punctatus DAOM BR117]|uniref:Uncharacterized protein n=1 Tax=Spizellomyces punctatus (strain DAOM BR117) TaxID=645134 RepID=A0A0L0H6W5_SPIPD|nr:uncharacterized protein SPPG_08194 [Spizellomyces punctatus DAOM BR117]KNC96611.1 hypothetical protein SPPG_08194 [Spizellomyces punctatus DAOM BR117]|eukprot:XP_016604651.1 hypothetical protein SPPG_08194 [Spizellomyces punctatus DAOM BR117]
MPVLGSCCCSIDLRTGFIIIATILLLNDIVSPNALLPKSSNAPVLNSPLINSLRWFDMAMVGLGLYGAIKNRIVYVKAFAIYKWISVALSLFVFILTVIALTASAPLLEEFCRQHNYENNTDCNLLIKVAFAAYTIVGGLCFAVSIYFGLCIWSYYQELRDYPEKYGVTPVGFIYLPVNGGEEDEERSRQDPFLLTPNPIIEDELPSYSDASLTGSSFSAQQTVVPKEKPKK